jgi:hypothetical protein
MQSDRRSQRAEKPYAAEPPPYPGVPRWVKIFGIAALAVVLTLLFVILTGIGGSHGPSLHLPLGGHPGSATPPEGARQ